jgi:hypothetical protein
VAEGIEHVEVRERPVGGNQIVDEIRVELAFRRRPCAANWLSLIDSRDDPIGSDDSNLPMGSEAAAGSSVVCREGSTLDAGDC